MTELTEQLRIRTLDLVAGGERAEESLGASDSGPEQQPIQSVLPGMSFGLGLTLSSSMGGILSPPNPGILEPGSALLESAGVDAAGVLTVAGRGKKVRLPMSIAAEPSSFSARGSLTAAHAAVIVSIADSDWSPPRRHS